MGTISQVKNWTDVGRNLLYEEMEMLKHMLMEKLKEKNLKPNVDIYFDRLFKYINAYFYNEEKIMTYINEEKVEYKFVKSIIENGAEFKNKSANDKKKFLNIIEEMYYGIITALNDKLIQINKV